jgi:hypothetical protein
MSRSLTLTLLAACAAGLLAGPNAHAAHPRIHEALAELRAARGELTRAAHDFGGHRKDALKAVDAAARQLEKALKYAGDPRPASGGPKPKAGPNARHHPHIHKAIHELRQTARELRAASHNYGGHREKALKDVEAAIRQLELCLQFARKK